MSQTPRGENILQSLVSSRRVLITVGAGGVGKTTTAAALAVAAAQEGRRVLCLTIDPAKRLAQSLGLDVMTTEAQTIDHAHFAAAGVTLKGSLTVAMLDTKRTFDDIVRRHSSTPEHAERLLRNKVYQYVSTSLAGTQEYMAMEKLVAVKADPLYDLVVLDTPPTANALDFLDAPERMMDALDSAAMRWFVEAFQQSGKFSLNILAKGAAAVLQTIGTLIGAQFLQDLAQFLFELNDLFGGFRQRALVVQKALRSPDVSFVLVTSPAPMSIQEVSYFYERLESAGMPRGAFVVNRFRLPPPVAGAVPDAKRVAGGALLARGVLLEEDAPERIVQAYADAGKLAALDARHVAGLAQRVDRGVPVVRIPELSSDVHDAKLLSKLSGLLTSGGV